MKTNTRRKAKATGELISLADWRAKGKDEKRTRRIIPPPFPPGAQRSDVYYFHYIATDLSPYGVREGEVAVIYETRDIELGDIIYCEWRDHRYAAELVAFDECYF